MAAMLGLALVLVFATIVAVRARAPRPLGWALQALWTLWLLEAVLHFAGVTAPWAPPGPAVYPPGVERAQIEREGVGHSATLFQGIPEGEGPRVLLLGDSFTEGQGVPAQDALPARLPHALEARGHPMRVGSLGISGVNIDEEAVLFEVLGRPLAPEIVVQVWVLNDIYLPVNGDVIDFITDHRSDQRPSGWKTWDTVSSLLTLRSITTEMTAAYQEAYTPDAAAFAEGAEYLDTLGARGTAAGARMVLVIFPLLTRLDDYPFQAAHDTLRVQAESAGYEVVDLLDVFAGLDASGLWVHPADQHPNARALTLAADAIADHLAQGPQRAPPQWGCDPPLRGARIPPAAVSRLAEHCRRGPTTDTLLALTTALLEDQRARSDTHWGRMTGISFLAGWTLAEDTGDSDALARLRALRATHGDLAW